MPELTITQTRIADLGKPRVIVVGGGCRGFEAAKHSIGKKVRCIRFDKYNHHTFHPLLYQVATSTLKASSIVYSFYWRYVNVNDFHRLTGNETVISLIGFRNKFFVFIDWMRSYFSYDKINRIITVHQKDGAR